MKFEKQKLTQEQINILAEERAKGALLRDLSRIALSKFGVSVGVSALSKRLPKEVESRQVKRVAVYLTSEDRAALDKFKSERGHKSLSESMAAALRLATNSPDVAPIVRDEVSHAKREINAIGVNVNQIAHAMNEARVFDPKDVDRTFKYCEEIDDKVRSLTKLLRDYTQGGWGRG